MAESELNNQGDYISGEVGEDGKAIVVGKNIKQHIKPVNQRTDVNVNLEPPRPIEQELRDIRVALLGDDYTPERPGLIKRVGRVEERLGIVETEVINVKNLVIVRNENRGKVHLTPGQLLWLIVVITIIVLVVVVMAQRVIPNGVLDGSVGFTLFYLFHRGLGIILNGCLCAITAAT